MKRLFLATTAFVALAAFGLVEAADLAVKAAPIARPACAQFGGFWLGAQAGWAKYDHQWWDKDGWAGIVNDDMVGVRSHTNGGFRGGNGGRNNWQTGCTVFGVSIDYNRSSINAANTYTDGEGVITDTLTVSSRLKDFGTAQARTGIVVDNLLLYVTGGLAFARFNREWTLFDDGNGVTEIFSQKRTGWGGGGG